MSEGLMNIIGSPEAMREFVDGNRAFVESLPELRYLIETALNESRQDTLNDRLVVELANLAWEDFEEIVTLCANGSTRGGLKILRAMFEHTVTFFQMTEGNEEEATAFVDYYLIDQYKAAQEINRAYPGEYFSAERFKQIEENRNQVKGKFLIECDDPKCKKCCKPRVNHAWSRMHIVQMAKNRGFPVYQVAGAYYLALDETHPKMGAIYHRASVREDESECDDGKGTLVLAHGFLVEITRVLIERSGIKHLEEQFAGYRKGFNDIWGSKVEELEQRKEA